MHPTIVLTTSPSEYEPRMRLWGRFRDHVRSTLPVPEVRMEDPSGEGDQPSRAAASFWRLFAPNHRELARSFFLYGSLPMARKHLADLIERRGQLTVVTLRGSEPRTHGWYAALDGSPLFTCSRWYSGNTAASQAGLGALRALDGVQILDSARLPALDDSAGADFARGQDRADSRLG